MKNTFAHTVANLPIEDAIKKPFYLITDPKAIVAINQTYINAVIDYLRPDIAAQTQSAKDALNRTVQAFIEHLTKRALTAMENNLHAPKEILARFNGILEESIESIAMTYRHCATSRAETQGFVPVATLNTEENTLTVSTLRGSTPIFRYVHVFGEGVF